jgi:hypothetical protein
VQDYVANEFWLAFPDYDGSYTGHRASFAARPCVQVQEEDEEAADDEFVNPT